MDTMMRRPLTPPPTGRLGLYEFVEPVVQAVLADRLGIDTSKLTFSVSLSDDLAVDSLDLLEVVIDLEGRFAVNVPEHEIDRVRTLADLVSVLVARLWRRDHPSLDRPVRRIAA
jgi:acyl carrier protein